MKKIIALFLAIASFNINAHDLDYTIENKLIIKPEISPKIKRKIEKIKKEKLIKKEEIKKYKKVRNMFLKVRNPEKSIEVKLYLKKKDLGKLLNVVDGDSEIHIEYADVYEDFAKGDLKRELKKYFNKGFAFYKVKSNIKKSDNP